MSRKFHVPLVFIMQLYLICLSKEIVCLLVLDFNQSTNSIPFLILEPKGTGLLSGKEKHSLNIFIYVKNKTLC